MAAQQRYSDSERMEEIMRRRIVLAAAIAVGLSATYATAHAAVGDAKKSSAHRETRAAAHDLNRHMHHRDAAHRTSRSAGAYVAPPFYGPPGMPVYRRPGYTYAPRKGIVDEACNLPTSACPNELRDIQ